MNIERWERVQSLFHDTADRSPSEQEEFLRLACSGDESLIADVQAMLAEDSGASSLLDQPLPAIADALLEQRGEPLLLRDFGPYRIKNLLGEGGMGVVYLAEREDFGSLVAIKVLRDGLLSPARRERFRAEQRTLAHLVHPLIARIFDADTLPDGTPWFSMEYVEGLPITQYCRERNYTIAERLKLFRMVCVAVEYAHSHAIIHRDLKPSNILVKPDGSVKLLDFGIAKQLAQVDEPSEQTLLRPMTLAYAAPEQIRGGRLGTQTDVYSLGVLFYELFAGRLPFNVSNKSQTECEQIILNQDPDPPSSAAKVAAPQMLADRSAWSELDVICSTALHKDLERRYRSVEALIRDLDHYLRDEPLEARPDSIRYRAGKFFRRQRHAILTTAAAILIVVGSVVFFTVRLARARNLALAEARRTRRIEDFMLNLFDGGDKATGPSGSLRAVSLVDRGVKDAESLQSEPAIQSDLYQTLGSIYEKLGKYDQADPLLKIALQQRKQLSGDSSRDAAESMVALGTLRLDQGQLPEAEKLVRDALAIDRRNLPPNDPALERDASALGRVLEEKGAYDEAVKTLEETVRVQSSQNENNPDLSLSLNELATAHRYLGHFTQAESLYKQALTIDRAIYGGVHPRVADDTYSLGTIQHDLGQDREAEQYYRQALAIDESWYGKQHPDTALIMAAVGQSLVYQGRFDEAAAVLQEALGIQEQIFGKAHPQVAMGLNTLGVLELKRGHLSDAEKDFIRMADINRAVYDDRHYLVGAALLNLGEVYVAEKNYPQGERSYREALSRFQEKLPPDHPYTAVTQSRLGHALLLQKKYKEAETHLLAGYEVLVKQPGPNASRIHNARTDLVAVYSALQQPAQAAKYKAELKTEEQSPDKSTAK